MKAFRLFAFLALSFVTCLTSTAQSFRMTTSVSASGNTGVATVDNTNAQVTYLYAAPSRPDAMTNVHNASFQYVGTKVSGTIAGSVTLQYSLDGVNYLTYTNDSLTMANVPTNTYAWTLGDVRPFHRLRIITTAGTQVLRSTGYSFKPPN